MINGLVDRPLVFTYADLERFPRVNHVYFCECAANTGMEWAGAQLNGAQFTHGMIHNMEYTGVKLSTLLEEAGVNPEGKWVYVEGADASSNGRSIPLEKAMDDVIVAFKANGEALRKEHGYPVRLVVPGWEGNMWVKWLRRIEVAAQAVESRKKRRNTPTRWPTGRRANGHGSWTRNPWSRRPAPRCPSPMVRGRWSFPAWPGRAGARSPASMSRPMAG